MLRFQELRGPRYVPFCIVLEKLISSLIKEQNLKIHQVTSRVKEINSFSEKIKNKQGKYFLLSDVTDLVGIRIITHLESEVDQIEKIIKDNFEIDSKNSIDKRMRADADSFGYQSLHIIAKLNSKRRALPEFSEFKDIPFEIQVRSILQHAWAEIEHDINYKSKISIENKTKRKIHRVAALLEQADEIFSEISNEVSKIAEPHTISQSASKQSTLTPEILSELLELDARLIELQNSLNLFNDAGISKTPDPLDVVAMRLADLNKVGIFTIEDIDNALSASSNYMKDFMSLMFMDEAYEFDENGYEYGADVYYRSACLTYLCQFTVGLSMNQEEVLSFLSLGDEPEEYEIKQASCIIKHIKRLNVV